MIEVGAEGLEGKEGKGISIFTPSGLSVRQEEERKAEMAALMKGVKEHKAYVRKMIYEGMGGWRGIMTDLMRKDNEQIRLNWALREFSTLSEDKGAANIQTDEPRLQSLGNEFLETYKDVPIYITIKMDGTSGTFIWYKKKFSVASRNVWIS